uniref:Uncharacterized protein n=1 Tax=Anguilla anguilla TaxID=7936 RepID=A0A0E9WQW4_ANGAN
MGPFHNLSANRASNSEDFSPYYSSAVGAEGLKLQPYRRPPESHFGGLSLSSEAMELATENCL